MLGMFDLRNKLIRVTGKRRKERIVPFGEPALETLQQYLGVREGLLSQAPDFAARREGFIPELSGDTHHYALGGTVGWKSTFASVPACTTSARTL